MIEIGIIIAIVMAVASWIKAQKLLPTSLIPGVVVILAVLFNLLNAWLYGDISLLEAGRNAFITAIGAIGIHSGLKNTFQK